MSHDTVYVTCTDSDPISWEYYKNSHTHTQVYIHVVKHINILTCTYIHVLVHGHAVMTIIMHVQVCVL